MALLDTYELADRYRTDSGRIFASGSQVLARVAVAQLRADRARGLRTAAYATGYPGSPLANFDRDLRDAAAQAALDGLTMVTEPGLNEELAAAAVMGTQLAATLERRRFDGVIGVWFGKAPGLDRAGDALRHAMFAGTAATGGAIAVVGDDPNAKSSTLPSSSDAGLAALHMPVLFPGDVQDAADLGRHAIALSRASGLWTAIKVVDTVADGTGTVLLHAVVDPQIPIVEVDGRPWVPRPSGALITPRTLDIERELHELRLRIAREYATLNHLNRVEVGGPGDWLGIIAGGHTYREARAALEMLGFGDEDALHDAGIRLVKVGMTSPLDHGWVRTAADGLDELVVIEEKDPNLEWLVKDALYDAPRRPLVSGKRDPSGDTLFPYTGAFTADTIAARLRARLTTRLPAERMTPPPAEPRQRIAVGITRTPYFCSGCPHNTSTQAPAGTLVGAGIGCHTMALFMDPQRVGDIVGVGAMGTEGAPWLGIAPFVHDPHLVQNLGDGTLFHSGILAIRALAASGRNITYKILYNRAVAMTGGQDPYGGLAVPDLAGALLAEGVRRVLITTDDTSRYRGVRLPDGVEVWDRARIIEAQQLLAGVPGCTVLIHDQQCAAELRRDRRRGRVARPATRVLINPRVCEGCGHCAAVSNCLSVQPIDTPFGRKTTIDQHSCNLDMTCLEGDCPAFATVTLTADETRPSPHSPARSAPSPEELPEPDRCTIEDGGYTIRLSGIGGTGVVTVSQVLGTAAMLDGLTVRGLDQTGLSQKAGPVVSDLRITREQPAHSNRAVRASVDVLLAFDRLGATSDAQIAAASPDRTVIVANTAETPTGAMVTRPHVPFPTAAVAERVASAGREVVAVAASPLTRALLGDDTTVNVFMTGVAAQRGLLPMSCAAIERAIELNGVAVPANLAAFRWGRAWSADPEDVQRTIGVDLAPRPGTPLDEPVGDLIRRLADDLAGYQSARTVRDFRDCLAPIEAIGHDPLTRAAATSLHKLTAYKDEYEVARLLLLPESRAQAERIGGRRTAVTWHLHPPALRALGMRRKLKLGGAARPMLVALRAMRRVRGSALDPFGRSSVRRLEREMIPEFAAALQTLADGLADDLADDAPDQHQRTPERLAEATRIAGLADQVRGYEHLKVERATAYRQALAEALDHWQRHP